MKGEPIKYEEKPCQWPHGCEDHAFGQMKSRTLNMYLCESHFNRLYDKFFKPTSLRSQAARMLPRK